MIEDEELVKALLDNLVESEDWKVAFLLCKLVASSSSLRLCASKHVLKTSLAKEIGRLIYNNIHDFTLMNYIVEFVGRTIPQRKVTVGDSFISRLWGVFDPEILWNEFPFRALAGDQRTIEYIKKAAKAYTKNQRTVQPQPKTNFMPMLCLDISGKKFSFNDEGHIILQVKDQSMYLWYPATASDEQSSNCSLELLEIDLASLAQPPATAPLNITLYFEASIHNREYAAIDTTVTWKQLKVTLFSPSEESHQDLIAAITEGCALPLLSQQKSKEAESKAKNTDGDTTSKKKRNGSKYKLVSRSRQLISVEDNKVELEPNPIDDQLDAEESVSSMYKFINNLPEDVDEAVDSHTVKPKSKKIHIPDSQPSQPPPKKSKLVKLTFSQAEAEKKRHTASPSLPHMLAASTLPSPESSNQSISFSQPKESSSQQPSFEEDYERVDNPVIIVDDDDYYQPSQGLEDKPPAQWQQTNQRESCNGIPEETAPTPPSVSRIQENSEQYFNPSPSIRQNVHLPPIPPVIKQQTNKSHQQPPSAPVRVPKQAARSKQANIPLTRDKHNTSATVQSCEKPRPISFQSQEPVPFLQPKQPLFYQSLLHDELEEINNQIYASLKSGSRKVIKRLQRLQNLLNAITHATFLSKYYDKLHEIQTKRKTIKANLTSFVTTNKWSPINI